MAANHVRARATIWCSQHRRVVVAHSSVVYINSGYGYAIGREEEKKGRKKGPSSLPAMALTCHTKIGYFLGCWSLDPCPAQGYSRGLEAV
jgi:hypothetical protein